MMRTRANALSSILLVVYGAAVVMIALCIGWIVGQVVNWSFAHLGVWVTGGLAVIIGGAGWRLLGRENG